MPSDEVRVEDPDVDRIEVRGWEFSVPFPLTPHPDSLWRTALEVAQRQMGHEHKCPTELRNADLWAVVQLETPAGGVSAYVRDLVAYANETSRVWREEAQNERAKAARRQESHQQVLERLDEGRRRAQQEALEERRGRFRGPERS